MLANAPWDLAPDLPWRFLTSPASQWAVLPSFAIGECLFILCAVAALIHARRCGRDHLMIWIGALLTGTANDMIFMALPLVDNFWQAQAMVMLTPRLPLYIPCVYVCFMYFPTAAVRRLGLGPWSGAALTGLVACGFYAPYDIIGAKFIWWSWHDTDLPIAARLLGAPVSSSLWVLTFVGSFARLMHWGLAHDASRHTRGSFMTGLAIVGGLSTTCMMVQITVLQQLDGGAPAYWAFGSGLSIYALIVWRGRANNEPQPRNPHDRLLHAAVVGYFVTLTTIMAVFEPSTHVSAGLHQPPGQCYVEAKDITGLTRHKYLCVEDYDEDYTFACADSPPADGSRWYTVCGKPHSSFARWMAGVLALGTLGVLVFSFLLGPLRRS